MVGAARCIVEDPQSGPTAFDVAEINAQGAVLRTPKAYADNDYLDVALELSGSQRVALFAQVAGNEGFGLKLRWMHMDPSEETALDDLLKHWQAGEFDEVQLALGDDDGALDIFGNEVAPKAKSEREGTRRVTRPDMKPVSEGAASDGTSDSRHKTVQLEVNPAQAEASRHKTVELDMGQAPVETESKNKTVRFEATPMNNRVLADGIADAVDADKPKKNTTRRIVRPQTEAPAEPVAAEEPSTKRKTRRIVKPGQAPAPKPAAPPAAPAAKAPADIGDDSGAHNVVVTNTKRFQKLKGEGAAKSSSESEAPRQNVLSEDGKLDVGASIRNSAKTVSASELAERHDKLKVLNMSTIKSLISAAVAEAVEQLGGALDAKEKERLLKEAEDGFKERLESFKAEKKGMEEQAKRLRDQLDRAQELLEDEKKRKIEKDQFTVSDSGIANLEKQFERMLSKASKTGSMDNEFEDNLRKLVNNLLDDEREKIAEQARKAQDESIKLLERKVQRLAGSLQDTEKERDAARRHANELAKSGGGGGSVQNMYDVGLADDDANKEAKLALLKDIFAQNKEMRDHMAKTGKKVEGRKRPPKPQKTDEQIAAEKAEAEAAKEADEAAQADSDAAAAEATQAAETAEADSADLADDGEITDPDDMPWEPGKTVNIEDELGDDDEDEDAGPVKKIVVTDFEPPKLERKKKPAAKAEPEAAAATEDTVSEQDGSEDDLVNPDDMPWEPAGASDAEDEDEASSGVKKMSIKADFEPPPLNRKK